jgi:two-component system NarL family sensor kinase
MRDHLILTAENAFAFERSINFLQQALMEFRRISLGMMPELLYKYGLDEALRRKCAEISAAESIEVQYYSTGLDGSGLSSECSISVYRIIQELLADVVKHVAAHRVNIELKQMDGKVQLYMHVDGVGMLGNPPMGSGRSGLQDIQQQVESLRGNMHVDSVKDKGTRVHIALHI